MAGPLDSATRCTARCLRPVRPQVGQHHVQGAPGRSVGYRRTRRPGGGGSAGPGGGAPLGITRPGRPAPAPCPPVRCTQRLHPSSGASISAWRSIPARTGSRSSHCSARHAACPLWRSRRSLAGGPGLRRPATGHPASGDLEHLQLQPAVTSDLPRRFAQWSEVHAPVSCRPGADAPHQGLDHPIHQTLRSAASPVPGPAPTSRSTREWQKTAPGTAPTGSDRAICPASMASVRSATSGPKPRRSVSSAWSACFRDLVGPTAEHTR